jgi:parvulin-like peptidyl-prolyl isomerase
MLDKFRENARSTVIQIAIGAVAVVFIFSFGPGSRGCGEEVANAGATWAAEVNGETVPASAFNRQYLSQVNTKRMMRGGTYSNEDARRDDLRAEVMKDVVDAELIAQAAERHGLWVGDDEVLETLEKNQNFQKNGVFDEKLYRKYLAAVEGLSPSKYEERLRRALLANRMLELTLGTVAVSDDELKAEFVKAGEGASIDYVRFAPGQFTDDVTVADAEVEKVLADKDAVAKKYEDTRFRYTQPKGVQVRRLYVPVKSDAAPEADAAAKAQLEAALAQLEAGKTFAEVTATLPDDPAAEQDGIIGWVELGRSPFGKRLEEAAFKLKPGERSAVLRDLFGYQVVEVVAERPASEKKLEEVQREVAAELAKEQKAKELAQAAAKATLEKLEAGEQLAAQWPKVEAPEGGVQPVAKKPQVASTETFHPYGGSIPGVGPASKLSATVFALAGDRRVPGEVIEDLGAYWVFELKSRERADLTKFDEQKEQLRERLEGQKKFALRDKWVEALRAAHGQNVKENPTLLSYDRLPGATDR